MKVRFFDRFRTAQRRYARGVHELSEPATPAAIAAAEARVGGLPDELRDFLGQWNGGYLFHDDYALFGVEGARPDLLRLVRVEGPGAEPLLALGEGPDRSLFVDGRGRVLARHADTEELVVEGSGLERWLDATLAREALVYDRDGEFREEAFDGGELSDGTRRKRAQAALKADPDAPAWNLELAELFLEGGEPDSARELLEHLVEGEPGDAGAWLLLGRLRREAGDLAGASAAFVAAADAERDDEEKAFALASAARAAGEAGLDGARALGERAAAAMPGFVVQQREAANHLLDEGDVEGALQRLSLAAAAAPDDAALRAELARARARRSLKTI